MTTRDGSPSQTGQLKEGVAFCMRNPEVIKAILIYSLASAVGQNFIYYTITQFNALVLTTVTTVRKIFTTVYSVFRNPANSLTNGQWGGCALVFVGKWERPRPRASPCRHCCRPPARAVTRATAHATHTALASP